MQAWNQVKVIDQSSEHAGRAGMVQGVEKVEGVEHAAVRLDETDELHEVVENFTADQLQVLV